MRCLLPTVPSLCDCSQFATVETSCLVGDARKLPMSDKIMTIMNGQVLVRFAQRVGARQYDLRGELAFLRPVMTETLVRWLAASPSHRWLLTTLLHCIYTYITVYEMQDSRMCTVCHFWLCHLANPYTCTNKHPPI